MKPENKKFLDDNRHHYDVLIKAFYLRHLDGNTRSMMQQVMSEEFQPGYATDLWCGPCVSDMVKLLYSRYDKWIAEQEVIPVVEPVKIIEPVKIAANFPKHKKR